MDSHISDKFLHYMGACIFEMQEGGFRLKSDIPVWCHKLDIICPADEVFDLSDYFPFIETVLPQFKEESKGKDHFQMKSDLWSEKGKGGDELLLQAVVLKDGHTNYVMLVNHETVLSKNREILQKAREQSLLKDKIAKARDELQQLLSFKDQFVSIVSHDLRSPVSSAVMALDVMVKDENFLTNIDPLYREFFESINKDLKLLLEYNERLYHWSNLQLGKFNLSLSKVNVCGLINASVKRFEPQCKAKKLHIFADCNDNMEIDADEALFSQVLNNLIGNALKFTPANGSIILSAEKQKGKVMITIQDTGVGIKPSVAENLFTGYVAEHTDGTGGEKGTGLGLGICKKIIDAHGYSIRVESEVGKGTSFIITI